MIKWIKSWFKSAETYRYDRDLRLKDGDRVSVGSQDEVMSTLFSAAMDYEDGVLTIGTSEYRYLNKGEIIREGDETDKCVDPWRDEAVWKKVHLEDVGDAAPDPKYVSHRIFRRKNEQGTNTRDGI